MYSMYSLGAWGHSCTLSRGFCDAWCHNGSKGGRIPRNFDRVLGYIFMGFLIFL